MEELVTVYFEGNPLMWEAAAGYRIKIKLALPRIQQIDASKFFFLLPFFLVLVCWPNSCHADG